MPWNSSNRPSVLKDYDRIVNGLYSARIEFEIGMKYKDLYGGYGMVFSRHITPYFWIIPLMASSLPCLLSEEITCLDPCSDILLP